VADPKICAILQEKSLKKLLTFFFTYAIISTSDKESDLKVFEENSYGSFKSLQGG